MATPKAIEHLREEILNSLRNNTWQTELEHESCSGYCRFYHGKVEIYTRVENGNHRHVISVFAKGIGDIADVKAKETFFGRVIEKSYYNKILEILRERWPVVPDSNVIDVINSLESDDD